MDIINEILEACILEYPDSSFIIGLYKQYMQRGSLSKKQLQGLHGKALKIADLPPGKLATLEAIINRMPTRFRSEIPATKPMFEKNAAAGKMISDILEKYPQHKRVLALNVKYEANQPLTPADIDELKRFAKLLLK